MVCILDVLEAFRRFQGRELDHCLRLIGGELAFIELPWDNGAQLHRQYVVLRVLQLHRIGEL